MKGTILFVCAGFGGGIGKMIRFVSNLCLPYFDQVYLLHRGAESEKDIAPEGVIERVISKSEKDPMVVWRSKEILKIRKEINRIKPEIVCCFGSEISVVVTLAMIGAKRSIKIVLAERGDPYTLSKPWQLLNRWAFSRADKCVFQLEKQGRWFGEGVMNKGVVIPNAFIPTSPIEHFNGEREKTIVSVGRFVYEKRYEVLIQAFAKVHKLYPSYRLILYGDGPYRAKYEALIREYGLVNHVNMPGYTKDSMSSIRNASVFVLSSLYEGMPNTLIEALAVGVPTVSTDCTPGGPDYLTKHGTIGLLVPVDDVTAMTNAIIRIIENPELASELSLKGQTIVEELDPLAIKKRWVNFFLELKD